MRTIFAAALVAVVALVALVVGPGAPAARAGELVANPDYERWVGFKPGSWVTFETECVVGTTKGAGGETLKLIELTAEKAVLDVDNWVLSNGKRARTAEARRGLLAKFPKRDENDGRPVPKTTTQESDVTIEAGGKKLACHLVDATTTIEGGAPLRRRTWLAKEVPGGVARNELESKDAGSGQTTTLRWLAVGWEAAK